MRKLFVVVFAVLAACASVPRESFAGYRDAVGVVAGVSQEFAADGFEALAGRPAAATAEQDDELREAALAAYAAYVDALSQLADGKSEEQVSASVGGLLAGVQRVAGLTGYGTAAEALHAVAAEVVLLLQRDYEAREFRRGVTSASPFVQQLEQLLTADITAFSKARGALLDDRLEKAKEELLEVRQAADAYAKMCAAVDGPAPGEALAVLNGRLGELKRLYDAVQPPAPWTPPQLNAASPLVVAPLLASFDALIARAAGVGERVRAIEAERAAYGAFVARYREAIDASVAARESLEVAVNEPAKPPLKAWALSGKRVAKALQRYLKEKE